MNKVFPFIGSKLLEDESSMEVGEDCSLLLSSEIEEWLVPLKEEGTPPQEQRKSASKERGMDGLKILFIDKGSSILAK